MNESEWARRPTPLPKRPAMAPEAALRVLGAIILYLTIAPPVAVILWRLATMPW